MWLISLVISLQFGVFHSCFIWHYITYLKYPIFIVYMVMLIFFPICIYTSQEVPPTIPSILHLAPHVNTHSIHTRSFSSAGADSLH